MRGQITAAIGKFEIPSYPYEALSSLKAIAQRHAGGVVDLSIGSPCDQAPRVVLDALRSSANANGYPASAGSPRFREAASGWMRRRFGVDIPPSDVAACVGTKELVASAPGVLRLHFPGRDTVLYPAISYPTYEMGAVLAGLRAVPVPIGESGGMDLGAISPDDASRALALWVNSPSNPTGKLSELAMAANWGRLARVPVFSDECYTELTWLGRPRSILEHGSEGVVAVHSLSKRSNLAGLRAGFYAGDPSLVHLLREVRRHAGLMVPGPVQEAAAAALDDDEHVRAQRREYRKRLERFIQILVSIGVPATLPEGGFYLWVKAEGTRELPGDSVGVEGEENALARGGGWVLARSLARQLGVLVAPGDLYGPPGAGYVRIAMVQPMERLDLVAGRAAR